MEEVFPGRVEIRAKKSRITPVSPVPPTYPADYEDTDSIQQVIRYDFKTKQAGFLADGSSYLPRLPIG